MVPGNTVAYDYKYFLLRYNSEDTIVSFSPKFNFLTSNVKKRSDTPIFSRINQNTAGSVNRVSERSVNFIICIFLFEKCKYSILYNNYEKYYYSSKHFNFVIIILSTLLSNYCI